MKPLKMKLLKTKKELDNDGLSFARQAARASLVSPFIAFGMNIMSGGKDWISEHPSLFPILLLIGIVIILCGLVFSIIGLCGVKKCFQINKEKAPSLLIMSLIGLFINGMVLVSITILVILPMLGITNRSFTGKLTITPPEKFEEITELVPGNNRHFREVGVNEDTICIWFVVITIEGMVKPKENQYLKNSYRKSDHSDTVTFFTENWKGHTIEVARTKITCPGIVYSDNKNEMIPFVSFDAVVPIAPKAIIIKINGLPDREEEMKKYLKEILKGIDGPTNW